jgi:hypothetical protein
MVVISPGWDLDVERGPDWLIVGIRCGHENEWDSPPLAEGVWHLLEQSFTHRVVVDLSQVSMLHTWLIGQLVQLQRRIGVHEGVRRDAGLRPDRSQPRHPPQLPARRLLSELPRSGRGDPRLRRCAAPSAVASNRERRPPRCRGHA